MERQIKTLICGKILTPQKVISKGIIVVQGAKIAGLYSRAGGDEQFGGEIIDLDELTLLPGFIDTHIHGWGGNDFNLADGEMLAKASALLPSFGITSYTLTLCDLSIKDSGRILGRAGGYISTQTKGARVVGFHLEGPFLNPSRKGALRADKFVAPDVRLLDEYLKSGQGLIKMMTLSPELDGAMDIIEHLASEGVVPCAGHSEADYDCAREAIAHGVRHATHTFNAMASFHHRAPGLVGAVLTEESITAEVIPDGVHLHPAAVKLLSKVKGKEGLVAVSDGHPMAGLKAGDYRVEGGCGVKVSGNAVRLLKGPLAGGATPMNRLVKNMSDYAGWCLQAAVATATTNPARLLGIERETGSLETGKDADIVAVDSDFNVQYTMVKGETVFPL